MSRSRLLEEEVLGETAEGTEVLRVVLAYEGGGTNYFSGDVNKRGYVVRVTPETKTATGTRTWTLFAGIKAFVEPAKAFSAKKLAALTVDPALIAKLKAHVRAERARKEGSVTGHGTA